MLADDPADADAAEQEPADEEPRWTQLPGTTWVTTETRASIGTARGSAPSRPSQAGFHGWSGTKTMSPNSQ